MDYGNGQLTGYHEWETSLCGVINDIMCESYPELEWMQYTGINDINGKEIYEGDIIKFQDIGGEGEDVYDFDNIAVVTFNNLRWELSKFKYDDSTVEDEMCEYHYDFIEVFNQCEVIGNIYENSDLVKGE